MDIENRMVLDSQWKHLEKQVKEYGECAGCEEPIIEGEEYFEIRCLSNNETIKVHRHASCCCQFVNEMAWPRTAGEE